jgi:hypothetical protein
VIHKDEEKSIQFHFNYQRYNPNAKRELDGLQEALDSLKNKLVC